MERVPGGRKLILATLARGVDAEAVDNSVPDGSERVDDQRLAERNPDVIRHEVPKVEVRNGEVFGLLNRAGVFPDASVQLESSRFRINRSTLSRALSHSFTDVDRRFEPPIAIVLGD